MKHIYKLLFLVALLPLSVVANNENGKGKHTKEKKIHKEYTVNSGAGLEIDNSYGSINIVTWNQNKTVIDVVIKTNGNDEAKVSEKLKEISVDFTANSSKVSARTKFSSKRGNWNSWFGSGKNNVSVEVNYIIKLPVTNSVDLNNDYGSISIDKLQGNASINCDYGQLILGELLADNNYLNFDYTQNSTIQYMKSGKINADYSGFNIQKAESLEVNADYTTTEIGEVNELNYNNDHGKLSIGKVNNAIGRGDYIHHNYGSVAKSLNISTDYGSVKVDTLMASCKEVVINSDYTRISLGLSQGLSFDFKLNLEYCSIKGEDALQYTDKSQGNTSKLYLGYFGNKNSGNSININAEYGSVSFKKL